MFEDLSSAEAQILRDKHTLLEGYVTEYLFERQFLSQNPGTYTKGWWSAGSDTQRMFFVAAEELNDVDRAVMGELSKRYPCWQVYAEGDSLYFEDGGHRLTMRQFLSQYRLTAKRSPMTAAAAVRSTDRQRRCVDFFKAHQLMQKIAAERYFANNFLNVYFPKLVNIDFFVRENDGRLSAIEVKFKFEAKDKTFGINFGQYEMFTQLEKMGIQVQHWILYNSARDKDLSIFGFLDKKMEKYWLSGHIDTSRPREANRAPKDTSADGNRTQGYYKFGKSEFPRAADLTVE